MGRLPAEDGVFSLPAGWSLNVPILDGPLSEELNVLATLGVGDGGGVVDLRPSWKSSFLKVLCFVDKSVLFIAVVGEDGDDGEAKFPSANSMQSPRFFRNSSHVAESIVPASPNS